MKKLYPSFNSLMFFVLSLLLMLSSCQDKLETTSFYHAKTSYFIAIEKIRAINAVAEAPRKMKIPGKIYLYEDYLFINEVNEGIHIVDNKNPSSPIFLSFINIPGSVDLSINSNILYADSYVDLLAFDISNPRAVKQIKRLKDVFESSYFNKNNGTIVAYKDTLISYQNSGPFNGRPTFFENSMAFASSKASYGTGGSTARFTLMNNKLYTVDTKNLKVFDVNEPKNPVFDKSVNIGFGIETIFPYEDKLYIGSTRGMHIFETSNPAAPTKLSTYAHVTSCDPVVVQGRYAYVTLRSGTACRLGINVLEVIDVLDAKNPKLVSSFPMLNPHGLSINNENLFICEGDNGLKAFNSADVSKIGANQLSFLKGFNAIDVISGPKSLIVTGYDGVYQFNYSNPSKLAKLSHITLEPIYN
jgi:hypothetical protein